MREILTPWTIGNKTHELKITLPNGAAGLYHIFIDNYYQGIMMKREGQWVGYFNGPDIGAEEIEQLGGVIEEGIG